ncbi:TonB-dependent receptor [Gemmatimonas groenlandica]|uniref:TonB-dependent receptor n=1 Tax=Gemmatimonas groenlandica TaxID=2732249 RepID=A0A6M4IK80_9BACT|nr:TonB-dependent receptor [Gemmatimonas groenlandica]QJR34268.1 TonB-dependent receptor [Gemmatimonas groenlandica]
MAFWLAFLAAQLEPNRLPAQSSAARIEGKVRLRGSNAAVADATVGVEGTDITARTDSLGRYALVRVPAGPQVLIARRLGYASTRVPVTVPAAGARTVDIVLATSALQLDQLIVTADRTGRAKGELGTASVIDRDAIANQIASSLSGVLELIPGVPLQPPGLDAPGQFSLRALAGLGTTGVGGVSGPGAADIGAAGTLIVLDGIPLSNNANLQTVGVRGEIVSQSSAAGGGIDLRRIPATTLERVEVIRGIPSARWGDLTQGAIIVDTRAAATMPEFAGRFDPRTTEGNLVGGRGFATERQALTITTNLAETRNARTLSSATALRGAGQVAHRLSLGQRVTLDGRPLNARVTLDTRVDWWRLKFDSPERPDLEVGRNSFQDDYGLRLGERARAVIGGGLLEWTAAYDHQRQETRETRRISRPTTPFTNKLDSGFALGTYVEGTYNGAYELQGAPRLLYSRLEWDRSRTTGSGLHLSQLRIGSEVRREWNVGEGYLFDVSRPPQASQFNGTAGYDRPRDFRDTPPSATSGIYTDARLSARSGTRTVDLQAGIRLETLHDGSWWTSGVRSSQLQPRLTAQAAPWPWLRFRGGVGVVSKSPTIAQLNPARQYYDLVNVNRFTPAPSERLSALTTYIRDVGNPDLGLSRAQKQEVGFELDGGARRGSISVTWFDDRIRGAVTLRRDPDFLQRARYALADTGRGTGQPGRILQPPLFYEPVPVFRDRYVNSGRLDTRGVEYVVTLPVIPSLRTRLEISGAQLESSFATDDRDYGPATRVNDFQVDTIIKRIAYFGRASTVNKRGILTWRLVHHQPELGFVVTATVQQRLGDVRRVLSRFDSLAFDGYITRTGTLVPVPEADKLKPEFADLRQLRPSTGAGTSRLADDWLASIQVAKSLPGNGRLSFYIFNVLDKLVTISGGSARALPSTRFGAELTVPTASWMRGGP